MKRRRKTAAPGQNNRMGLTVMQLTEINLKNLWIMNHCKSFSYDSYQESLATLPLLGISTTKFKLNMPRELSAIYDGWGLQREQAMPGLSGVLIHRQTGTKMMKGI